MPITIIKKYGVHENVLLLEFGTGDIMFSGAAHQDEQFESMLMFSEVESHEIGAETSEYKGKMSDELPNLRLVMSFEKPESITPLIHSLVEIQKEVFRKQNLIPKK